MTPFFRTFLITLSSLVLLILSGYLFPMQTALVALLIGGVGALVLVALFVAWAIHDFPYAPNTSEFTDEPGP